MKQGFSITILLLSLAVSACSIAPETKRPARIYDFGLAGQPVKHVPAVLVQEVSAPGWLATPALQYRLLFQDPARLKSYAESRWAAAPAALLSLRLRQALTSQPVEGNDYVLRTELEEFSQLFDTPDSSRGLLRLRASLLRAGDNKIVSSRTFSVERQAATANAEGGVHALRAASDELVEKMSAWLNETLAGKK